ncbi:DUF3822 family protein [Aequorivita sp. H23M31]|uniref:DUF3822 family protein n=1 Tax=Aequorivita ciconiae TaxID=2494375 RepID=A0A410G1B1_9FLAO|nr:DUF3822 family protein [Aequorivita sp. H23M31]QAA81041.1 DUF3822 family protein [Aequorivita sp. H23M31]
MVLWTKWIPQETGLKFTTLSTNKDIAQLNTIRLSVQVSLNGLSFLAINVQEGKTLFFEEKKLSYSTTPEELLMEIENLIFENKVLQQDFSEVSVIYSTAIYGLVPTALFDESRASEYLKFNSKILANDYIAHDILENQGIVVVYVPYMNINNFFFEKYGSFNYYHSVGVLLKTLLEKENYSLPKMYLHFQQNSFDCIVLKNGELQLCNTYAYKTAEDFIYYTLFCMEQLKLNPETIPVLLCGEIEADDDIYKMAYTYIRNIDFVPKEMNSLEIDNTEAAHRHFTLKNLG